MIGSCGSPTSAILHRGMIEIVFPRFIVKNDPPVTIEYSLDHFDHAVTVMGVEP